MASNALAFTPEPPLEDAKQEEIAQSLFHELRCVVCEGQSLAESDATLARQMRSEIRRMVREGETAPAIIEGFRKRYGDDVLMSPPFDTHTYLLWIAPALLLAIGLLILLRRKA